MAGVHVAVIDDGINKALYGGIALKHDIVITNELAIEERTNYNPYIKSHGTVCTAIIEKYCKGIEISSIRILNDKYHGGIKQLVKAMEWCIENEIKIINLSAGTVSYWDRAELKTIVDKACKIGIVIVAANNNDGFITYPASFPKVIGVKCDRSDNLDEGCIVYDFEPPDGIEVTACGKHLLVDYCGNAVMTDNWNSYSAPQVSAMIANIINEFPNAVIHEIREKLWKQAVNYDDERKFYEAYSNMECIDKALIFRLNPLCSFPMYPVFKIEKTVNIRHESIASALAGIEAYLEHDNSIVDNIDTIIIDTQDDSLDYTMGALEKTLKYLSIYKKNIILMHYNFENKHYKKILRDYSPAVIYNSFPKLSILNKENSEETPVLTVLNYSYVSIVDVLSVLREFFCADGYIPITFTTNVYGLYCEHNYFRLEQMNKHKDIKNCYQRINDTVNFYNGDIGIVGMNCCKEISDVTELVAQVHTDIVVVIPESDTSDELYLYQFVEKVFVMPDYIININNASDNTLLRNALRTLYKKILALLSCI